MKKLDYVLRYISLLLTIYFALRFRVICQGYSGLYNVICHIEYWVPIVACFALFIYYYLKTAVKWRDDP